MLREIMLRHSKIESVSYDLSIIMFERILCLTQELLDQYLLKKGTKGKC